MYKKTFVTTSVDEDAPRLDCDDLSEAVKFAQFSSLNKAMSFIYVGGVLEEVYFNGDGFIKRKLPMTANGAE